MSSQQHIIKRLVLQLELHAEPRASFHLQNELKRICQNQLVNHLGRTLDELAPSDRIYRIPKLELDLGQVSRRKFGAKFREIMLKQLSSTLESFTRNYNVKQLAESDLAVAGSGWLVFDEGSAVIKSKGSPTSSPFPGKSIGVEALAESIPPVKRNRELFFHFLEKGTFPWWAKKTDWKVWEMELLEQLQTTNDSEFCLKTQKILTNNHLALPRLLWQFSKPFLQAVIAVFYKNHPPEIHKDFCIKDAFKDKKAIKAFFENRLLKDSASTQVNINGSASIIKNEFSPLQDKKLSGLPSKSVSDIEDSPSLKKQITNLPPYDNVSVPEPKDTQSGYYINNAGLALILPCLTFLFKELEYIDEQRQFKNKKTQERAIHLLHYLTTGKTQPAEPELVLNKIVCGWKTNEPLPKNLRLKPMERNAAETFLNTIITEWGALKNASPDSLRYNFLMRNGKLSLNGQHWLLQVEKTAYDPFLLKKLPWTISIIKLKWMTHRIHVEWVV